MRHCWFLALASIAMLCAVSPAAEAQASHTWVSAEGSDSNAGTRQSPFATFAEAISQTAVGGTVSAVDNGDYGPIEIQNSITIDGGGCRAWTTRGSSTACPITLNDTEGVAHIVLRNLDIDGTNAGNGIGGGLFESLVVENCTIRNFSTAGIIALPNFPNQTVSVRNTDITGGTYGVYVLNESENLHLTMRDCVITQATSCGIMLLAATLDINNSTISQNAVGLEASHSTISAVGCMLSGNTTAVLAATSGKIQLMNDSLFDNGTGISIAGGTVTSLHNNASSGNTTPGEANSNAATF